MSDELHKISERIERLEILISFLLMNEVNKNDHKFIIALQTFLKEKPSDYFDDLWGKYKSVLAENSAKLSQIEILNERVNRVDKLFSDLKNSADELSSKKNNS